MDKAQAIEWLTRVGCLEKPGLIYSQSGCRDLAGDQMADDLWKRGYESVVCLAPTARMASRLADGLRRRCQKEVPCYEAQFAGGTLQTEHLGPVGKSVLVISDLPLPKEPLSEEQREMLEALLRRLGAKQVSFGSVRCKGKPEGDGYTFWPQEEQGG